MHANTTDQDTKRQPTPPPMTLVEAAAHIQRFEQDSLRRRIAALQSKFHGADQAASAALATAAGILPELWTAAQRMKAVAGQINVIIHAAGILLALPYILEEGEVVEALSLGAGNTGVPFDLITNRRVAEFKFTHWRGGPEPIRENHFFKDFYLLAEAETTKDRYLYVVEDRYPLKFLAGRRSLTSVMSHDNKLWAAFQARYGDRFRTVREYYAFRQATVTVVDLARLAPHLAQSMGEDAPLDG